MRRAFCPRQLEEFLESPGRDSGLGRGRRGSPRDKWSKQTEQTRRAEPRARWLPSARADAGQQPGQLKQKVPELARGVLFRAARPPGSPYSMHSMTWICSVSISGARYWHLGQQKSGGSSGGLLLWLGKARWKEG